MADTFDPHNHANVHKTGLLICFPCSVIEEIPDYDPDNADHDPRIGHLVEAHLRRHPSFEDRNILEWLSLGFVPTKIFKDPQYKKQIIDQILKGNGRTGFDADFYETVNTFKQDAMECYKRHNRPAFKSNTQPKCSDYLSSHMEIKPNTRLERKVSGLASYDETKIKRVFACQYCPYHQSVRSELQK